MKLPLLPILAALCFFFGESAAPASTPPISTPPLAAAPAAGQTVYAGSFQNNWLYCGWAQSVSPCPSPALSPSSLEVQEGAWQAVYLCHAAQRTLPGMSVSFWINGGASGRQALVVKALRNGVPQNAVALSPPRAGVWQQVRIALPKLGVGSVCDFDGFFIQSNSPKTQTPFYLDKIILTGMATPPAPPAPPAAPGGLSATPVWATSCPTCGGMAMAHIALSWSAVSGASSYSVYRDGVKQTNQAAPGWTDMNVVSGQTYSYAVAATGPGGEGPRSAAVSVTAPQPPASAAASLTAPVNLSVQGVWVGATADTLSWSPVPGAASYNVYQYGTQVASGLKTASYAVPPSVYSWGLTYTVTAVDSMGMETLPSAVATAQGALNPAQQPGWVPGLPVVPQQLSAVPEWNGGLPRVHLKWKGDGCDYTYTLYRDGKQAASSLWGLNYYDTAVQPGETHSYSVTGVNTPWTQGVESLQSVPVSATVASSAPAPQSGTVQITGVEPNDDSAVVSFAAVPGAADYRVYDAAHPNTVKYSGGGLSIEMNGLDPAAGADLVVEAVDKLGPFQTMDGMAGPGAVQMGTMHQAINGQGDPSNIPVVLAASAPVHVSCVPRTLAGSQVFFDTFRNEQPLTLQPMPSTVQGEFYGLPGQYQEQDNDKWAVRNYGGDIADSAVFFMGNHCMDTLYDGGTPHTGDPMHNNNASLVMMPKATADISGGQVLHVTFEVDAHFDMRRWCDVEIGAAGDTLINPGKIVTGSGPNLAPTVNGNILRWQIDGQFHQLSLFQNSGTLSAPVIGETDMFQLDWAPGSERGGPAARVDWSGAPLSNGTAQDLDKRHRFDLYVSQTHYRVMECGKVIKDADFPAGATLPFSRCQVYFIHELYHTGNDRPELVTWDPADAYWYNNRPYSDERHWDNCGQEVLSSFPSSAEGQ